MTVANPGPGGFRPSLKTQSLGIDEEFEFRASSKAYTVIPITIDADLIAADANGDKIIRKGCVMGKVDATGKYTIYSNALAADAGGTAAGMLMHSVNLRDGDVTATILDSGPVIASRCSGLDVSARADLTNVIFR